MKSNELQVSTPNRHQRDASIIFLVVAYAIAFFLYYIDEGHFHFKGLTNPTEWIFLSIYALIFAGSFRLLYYFLRKMNLAFGGRVMLSIVLGIVSLPLLVITVSLLLRIF